MKFVKSRYCNEECLINLDHVRLIQKADGRALVCFSGNECALLQESYESVVAKIITAQGNLQTDTQTK